MRKFMRNGLIILAVLVIGGGLVWTGFMFGRTTWVNGGFWHDTMMGYLPGNGLNSDFTPRPYGMMGGSARQGNYSPGNGMMGGYGGTGMMGGYGNGMMGGFGSSGLNSARPLSIDQAKESVEAYLKRIGNPDLEIKEVMIFDNQAYAEIVEISTGVGAMEVLVDPVTSAVYPEFGPNMMWNLKYGMMAGTGGYGMMGGGMMGGWWQGSRQSDGLTAEMPITSEEAVKIAQSYLDQNFPNTQVEEHSDVFYGYYTLHILRDGNVVGMLSVNGYSGLVFPHTWHGNFIEMSEND